MMSRHRLLQRSSLVTAIGIVLLSIVGLAVILTSTFQLKKSTENRSKAAPGVPHQIKLVNRNLDATTKWTQFDAVIENGVKYEQNNQRFSYTGAWVRDLATTLASGGSVSYTGNTGDSVSFSTEATEITLLTYKGPSYGSFDVYIDNQFQETILLEDATAYWQVAITIAVPQPAIIQLPAGQKTIELKNVHNGSNTYFLFDGILENGNKVEQNDPRFTYAGNGWTRNSPLTLASGGTASFTSGQNDIVTFTTSATQITIIGYRGPGHGWLTITSGNRTVTTSNTATRARWQEKYNFPTDRAAPPAPPAGSKRVRISNPASDVGDGTGNSAHFFIFDGIIDNGVMYQQDSPSIKTAGGDWNSFLTTAASGISTVYTNHTSSYVEFYTTSSEITLVAYKGPGAGRVSVSIDDGPATQFNLYNTATIWQTHVTIPVKPMPTPPAGAKLIKIQNRPINTTNKNIIFDALIENGITYQEDSRRFTYAGAGWTKFASSAPNGGSAIYASNNTNDPMFGNITFYTSADTISLLSYSGAGYGAFDVYIDGVLKRTFVTTATTPTWQQKFDIDIKALTNPNGGKLVTLVNKPLDTTNKYLQFDAIKENNATVEQTVSRMGYIGVGWATSATTAASGGSTAYTGSTGDSVYFYTSAPSITLVGYKGGGYGSFDVLIDGQFRENIIVWGTGTQWKYELPLQIAPAPTPPTGSKFVRIVNKPTSPQYAGFVFDGIRNGASIIEHDSRSITYGGNGWNKAVANASYSGGATAYTSTANSEISFYTSEAEIWLLSYRGVGQGSIDVYVDGQFKQNINLYSNTNAIQPISIVIDPNAISPTDGRTKTMRVLEIRYFPPGVPPLNHPDTLSSQLRSYISTMTKFHGYSNPSAQSAINVEVVQVINRNAVRANLGNWYATTKAILDQDNICKLVHDNDIDQVWLWVDPRTGVDTAPGLEYIHSSPYFQTGSYYGANDSARPAFCNGQHSFVVMGFDTSRTADLAVHSLGHFMESLLYAVQGEELPWKRYMSMLNYPTFPRAERCGNVHFPPNGASDYDYANQTNVSTMCENWNPDGTGTKTTYNCSRWGCTQGGYLTWWFQNMPNLNNPFMFSGKKVPNWFDFWVDFDDVVKSYQQRGYFLNDPFFAGKSGPVDIPTVISSKTGTGTTASWNHQATGTDRFVIVSASYRAHNNTTAKINTLTYAGATMQFVRRDKYSDLTTELWYLINPPATSSQISAVFSADPEDYVFTATSFEGIDQSAPVVANGGNGSQTTSNTQSVTVAGTGGNIIFGVLTTYPDGTTNTPGIAGNTFSLWNFRSPPNNIESTAGIEFIPTGRTSETLSWTTPKYWPWATSAITFKRR